MFHLSISFSNDSAESMRKRWYGMLIKMIILRILPLIIIFQRAAVDFCGGFSVKYSRVKYLSKGSV